MKPAIQVEGISKQFRLGLRRGGGADYRTLREAIMAGVRAPWDRLRGRAPAGRADGQFWALKDVSFEVQPGEVIGIIGRNGSGKSTLLKILSQIYEPTTGRAVVRGRMASLLEVGTGFHPELTGRENIYLNGSILGMSRKEIDRKFDEIVAFSEIEQFLDTPVKRYSSGMYVRLAFAVAAHLEPDILIVDEVLAVGDAEFQQKCVGKMGEVARTGRTVLFVSHNAQAISRLTTRCVYLKVGCKEGDGPTAEVLAQYIRRGGQGRGRYQADPDDPPGNRVLRAEVVTSSEGGVHQWGRPVEVEFDLEVTAPSSALCFTFQILNDAQVPVCMFSSFNPGAGWGTQRGVYRLRCAIPRLLLYKGEYSLTTWLADRRVNQLTENLTGICCFQVDLGDLHRGQYDWGKGDCVYLEDHHWQSPQLL